MPASFARSFRKHLKWIWLEHGTWATLWTAFAFGVVVGWPPRQVTAAALAGFSAIAAAKVGVGTFTLLAVWGLVPWWGALAGLVFVDDLRAAALVPREKTRRLGMS